MPTSASRSSGCERSTDLEREIARNGLNAQVVSVGAKGCVVFSSEPVRNFRDFLSVDDRYSHAHWLFQHNGGVFLPPWGKIEQWLMSVQHDEADIDRFVDNFARFAAAVRQMIAAESSEADRPCAPLSHADSLRSRGQCLTPLIECSVR